MRSQEFVTEGGKAEPGPTDARRWAPDRPLPDGWLQAWRGDARTGTIETLPLSFNPNVHMTKMLSAYKWARDKKLLPVIPPEIWAMLALVEGREDFGYNGLVLDGRPQQKKFSDTVVQAGMTDYLNLYWIVFLHEKLATAQRTGIPFYRVWNGSSMYQARFDAQADALKNPKNKPFLDWFKQQLA